MERAAPEQPHWYARPRSELSGSAVDEPEPSVGVSSRGCFRPLPLALLVVYGAVGGWLYCVYWMYRNWALYRMESGYSRAGFWRRVRRATGYEISPFWRAVLAGCYAFCLFPAVERECRVARVVGTRAPVLLAFAFNALPVFAVSEQPLLRVLASPIWAVVPVQLAINRLNATIGRKPGFRTAAVELLIVGVGGYLAWR